jgi:transposase
LNDPDRKLLERWSKGRSTAARLVLRSKIVLLAAKGLDNHEIAAELMTTRKTVGLWRKRFFSCGPSGIEKDAPRAGRPSSAQKALERDIIEMTTNKEKGPKNATEWTMRTLARELGTNHSRVQRVWRANGLKPHLTKTFKVSNDPRFTEKLIDVVSLYLDPPKNSLVLSVDEKSQIQALDRTQPGLPG